jgi:hypothetical protein
MGEHVMGSAEPTRRQPRRKRKRLHLELPLIDYDLSWAMSSRPSCTSIPITSLELLCCG